MEQKTCERCGAAYTRPDAYSETQWAKRRYCRPACSHEARTARTRDVFWSRVDLSGDSDTVLVPLTRGMSTVIDRADLPLVAHCSWSARRCKRGWYAGNKDKVYMHRLLAGATDGDEIDHRDGNGLNNRRSNLRFCTRSQNSANKRRHRVGLSGFRGVVPSGRLWRGRISVNRVYYWTPSFVDPHEAAKARDVLGRQLYGDFYVPSAP